MEGKLSAGIMFMMIILLTVHPSASGASDWILFDTLKSGVKVYLDQESPQKAGDTIRFWEKFIEPNGDLTKYYVEIECAKKQIRSLSSITYDKREKVISSNHDPMEWKHIPPDTHSENLYKYFCK